MPNIKSAAKRVRTSAKNRLRNRAGKSDVAAVRRKLLEAIESGNKEAVGKLYSAYSSDLDKAAKKGIIKANNASRKKSRLAIRIAKITIAPRQDQPPLPCEQTGGIIAATPLQPPPDNSRPED